MAYLRTTWAAGDVITAEKLNNIEEELVSLDEGSSGYNPLPSYSVSDSGKFLRVNSSGNLAWQTVPSAESESY